MESGDEKGSGGEIFRCREAHGQRVSLGEPEHGAWKRKRQATVTEIGRVKEGE